METLVKPITTRTLTSIAVLVALTIAACSPAVESVKSPTGSIPPAGSPTASSGAGSSGQPSEAPVKLTVGLGYIPNVQFAQFYLADQAGYYRDAGLDVAITAGKGSGSTAQLVASKATQIGFADGFVVGNSVSKGLAIKSVASIYRRNPCAVIVLSESDIRGPKDCGAQK